jgi:hypothetical protein
MAKVSRAQPANASQSTWPWLPLSPRQTPPRTCRPFGHPWMQAHGITARLRHQLSPVRSPAPDPCCRKTRSGRHSSSASGRVGDPEGTAGSEQRDRAEPITASRAGKRGTKAGKRGGPGGRGRGGLETEHGLTGRTLGSRGIPAADQRMRWPARLPYPEAPSA